MRGMKFVMFAFLLLGAWPLLSSGQGPTRLSSHPAAVDEIVKRFIQASGGPELGKIGTETRRGTLIRGASGAVPFEASAAASGKWYFRQAFAFGDRVSYGSDGRQAWTQDGEGVSGLPPEERLDLILLLDIQAPLKMERLFPQMTIKGSERIGEKDAVVLSAVSEEGLGSELAFDRTTGLLLRAGDLFFEDYRDVGKVKRPFLVFFGKDGGPDSLRLKMQVGEIRQDVDLDETVFSKPACPLRPVPPLLYKLRKDVELGREALEAFVGVYQSAKDPKVSYTVIMQGPHLMIEGTGWGMRFEIRPESETDFFIRFLNLEFHFVKDADGRVTGLELGPDRAEKATKVK